MAPDTRHRVDQHVDERSEEAEAFIGVAAELDPAAVSACAGWTTHEVVAHVAGVAVEVNRHLDPYAHGDPVPPTRGFDEREAPLRAMSHDRLLILLDEEERRMRALVGEVLAVEPDAVIPWTGRRMAVAKFIPHLRNEHALHRWDLVGDDDVSRRLLGRIDLVEHSVGELGPILLRAGREHDPDPDADLDVRLRSPGQRDLRVVVGDGEAELVWAEGDDSPALELDAAARHLLIWGRRPDDRGRIHSRLGRSELIRVQALLAGY